MKLYRLFLFSLFLVIGMAPLSHADQRPLFDNQGENTLTAKQEAVQAALQGLKAVVELWRSKDFSSLYEWGTLESRRLFSKDQFIKLMNESNRQLQCCWSTLQDLRGDFKSPTQVYVEAKLGYENFQAAPQTAVEQDSGPSQWVISSSFDPRAFLMVLQQGRWKIDLVEILQASGYLTDALQVESGEP